MSQNKKQYIVVNTGGGGGVSNHNNLTGLQGGKAGEHYHLTASQHGGMVVANPSGRVDGDVVRWDAWNNEHQYVGITQALSDAGVVVATPQLVWATQIVAYAATLACDLAEGNVVTVGTLTGDVTHATPNNIPAEGVRVVYMFTQDATGGRTITWSAAHKGAAPSGSGTANQQQRVEFASTGTALIFVSASGWY